MKKLLIIAMLSFTIALPFATTIGCKTTPINTIVKTEGIIITSVDTGMWLWKDRVVAGKATQAQVDTVKSAYIQYYNSQMLAKAAIEMYMAKASTNINDVVIANQAVVGAQEALLSVLNSYLK